MCTNIITPAILIFNQVMGFFPEQYDATKGPEQAANRTAVLDTAQYLVSASLICSGLMTFIQVSKIKVGVVFLCPQTYQTPILTANCAQLPRTCHR
jgi:hypothetical protein